MPEFSGGPENLTWDGASRIRMLRCLRRIRSRFCTFTGPKLSKSVKNAVFLRPIAAHVVVWDSAKSLQRVRTPHPGRACSRKTVGPNRDDPPGAPWYPEISNFPGPQKSSFRACDSNVFRALAPQKCPTFPDHPEEAMRVPVLKSMVRKRPWGRQF